jgi:hypothetical protein
MRKSIIALALAMAIVPGGAEAKSCAALRAFNDQQPSMATTKLLPCHCIPNLATR